METVFQQRRQQFQLQTLKYLRYVFNDHFVIALMFLLGALLIQYSQLLANFPKEHLPIILFLLLVMAALLSLGRIATYLEPADQQFLLPKETDIIAEIDRATKRSFLIWTGLQTFVLLVLAPLFLKLGLAVWQFVGLLLVLALLKVFIFKHKQARFLTDSGLDWDYAIAYEERRKQSLLRFFALFTTVKGISSTVKRRKYLDIVLKRVKKSQLWHNLYWRAFLRAGDYLALYLRLFVLGILCLLFLSNHWLGAGLALLLNYLLLFQLLGLYQHYDYQYLTQLYPVADKEKGRDLQGLLRGIAYPMTIIQMLVSANLQASALILMVMLLLVEVYLPYKIKKMID